MASDGLWDEMKKDKIASIATENKADKTKVV
jgi:serine/threonine protein phosphatase PrpC